MGNMGYCRFQNTVTDLQDCYDNIGCTESEEEKAAEKRLIELCRLITEDYAEDE